MTTSTAVPPLTRPIRFAAGAAAFVIALGLTVLIGWFFNAHALVQVLPEFSPVRRNAAACLVLCGLALLGVALRGPRRFVLVCAGVVATVAILTLLEHALGLSLGIDEVLGPAYLPQGVSNPGRMPAVSAICFVLASVGLLTLNAESKRSPLTVVFDGSILAAVGLATIMASALGSGGVYGWGHVTAPPLPTAVGFLVLGLGMLALAWHVNPDSAGIPRWLPISVGIGVATSTLGVWQALIAVGHAPFELLSAVVIVGGLLMAPTLALTVYLAQRAHTQASALRLGEARIAGEKRVLEMVASGRALRDVLNALCKFVEDTAPECYCAVYLIDWSGPRFRGGAGPSLPASYNDSIDALPVRSEIGPCARAACLGTQVIVEDAETDPLWSDSPFRGLALAHGLRSCWSTPVYSLAGVVLGTFAVYQLKPARPTPLQQDLIAQVTNLARIAIERAEGEAALRRSEAFLTEGQRISATGSFVWRLDTDEITFSAELRRIFELDNDAPVTIDRITTRIHPDDVPLLAAKIELARQGVVDHDYEGRLKMPDGSVKYLRMYGHTNRDPDGRAEFAGAMQDITQQRLSAEALGAARSELARVSRITSLGALTASIAHEINQPLSGIITNASTCLRMLGADPPNVEGARETARRTIRDGNRAAEVISRLRALYSGREFSTELVDLNDAAREVITLWLDALQRHRVSLNTEFAPDLPMVMGDRLQLQQVVLNLLRNASDAMGGIYDRPRELLVKTEPDDEDRVRLSVRDVGVGFKPELADRLFGAFYTTKPDGLGIGLSVSRSIIESHHGNLWATLNSGPGATFSFSIPRDFRAASNARAPQPSPRPRSAARSKRPAVGNP